MNRNKKIDPKQYKGVLVEYKCETCNLFDSVQEEFKSNIAKIKSDSCSHFIFKFIYDVDKNSFKYILSFNCNKCQTDHMINIFNENLDIKDDIIEYQYKCKKCGNGQLKFNLLLEKKDDNNNNKNNAKKYTTNNIKEYRTDGEDNPQLNSNFKPEMEENLLGGVKNMDNQQASLNVNNKFNQFKCINVNYFSNNNKNNNNNNLNKLAIKNLENNNINNNNFNMNNNLVNNNINNNNNFNMNINMANNNNNFNMNINMANNYINNKNFIMNNNMTYNNNLNFINRMKNFDSNGFNYNNNNFNNFNYNNNNNNINNIINNNNMNNNMGNMNNNMSNMFGNMNNMFTCKNFNKNNNLNLNNNMNNMNNNYKINIMNNNNMNDNLNNHNNLQKCINIGNGNDTTKKITLIFQDMNGKNYPIEASYEDKLSDVIKNLLNKYDVIDKENASHFTYHQKSIKKKENVKNNNLKDGDIINFRF